MESAITVVDPSLKKNMDQAFEMSKPIYFERFGF